SDGDVFVISNFQYFGTSSHSGIRASELPPTVSSKPPHVLIAGAGIGGLMLANILEKTDITYEIFEKTKETKPIGAVITLNPAVFPVFEQLGLYEDFLKMSYPIKNTDIRNKDIKLEASIKVENTKELVGYDFAVCPRPKLYDLLLSHIPANKVHLGKRVVSLLQNKEGVMVRLHDGATVHGDILVGADGAYSGVRQQLYKQLSSMGKLPKSDSKPLTKGFICMVGLTNPMDPEKIPDLKDEFCHCDSIIPKNGTYSWNTLTLPGNVISWGTVCQLNSETFVHEHLRNSEWGPEANEQLIKEVSEFNTRYGKLGTLIEATPRDTISRVFLEDKFFETWTYARTVLIGDGECQLKSTCHKLLPSAGLGAVNAIQDAVVLANSIYEMKVTSYDTITDALNEYREQRYDEAKTQYESSKFSGKIFYGHTMMERAIRHVIVNYMPPSVQTHGVAKSMAYRPQIAFLPLTPNRGTADVIPQKPSAKYIAKQAAVTAV
ncbi:hypothetical protein BGX26_010885, partial [Mortierella sp. AD094]